MHTRNSRSHEADGLRSRFWVFPNIITARVASDSLQLGTALTESCKEWEQAVEVLRQMSAAAPWLKHKNGRTQTGRPTDSLCPRRWKLTSLLLAPSSVPARQTALSICCVSEQYCPIFVVCPAGRRAVGLCVPWLSCRLFTFKNSKGGEKISFQVAAAKCRTVGCLSRLHGRYQMRK